MTYVNNYEGGEHMPRRDGTGPIARGPMTGRGLGICAKGNTDIYGAGLGFGFGRKGCGRYLGVDKLDSKDRKEILQDQKNMLKSRLDYIDEQLDDL